ncbi:MAG: hypothetical protein EI684_15165, partial [Candidatus Viridilinea halotolerans]
MKITITNTIEYTEQQLSDEQAALTSEIYDVLIEECANAEAALYLARYAAAEKLTDLLAYAAGWDARAAYGPRA